MPCEILTPKAIEEIFAKLAQKHHTTPQEIYAQIRAATQAAAENASPGWKKIPHKGTDPTPEETLNWLLGQVVIKMIWPTEA